MLIYYIVCFTCACMDVPTLLELCLYDQLDIAGLLLVSLLFIAINTQLLNFYLFLVCLLFIAWQDLIYLHWDLILSIYAISLYICHAHFCKWGASFLYSSITLNRPLTLTWMINRSLQYISLVLLGFLAEFVYCAGADLHPLVNNNMLTQ